MTDPKFIQKLMQTNPTNSHVASDLDQLHIAPAPIDPLKQALRASKKRISRLHKRHERLKSRLQRTEFQLRSAKRDHSYHDAQLALRTKLTKVETKRPRPAKQISSQEVADALTSDVQRILDLIPPEKRQKVLLAFENSL